MSDSPNPTSRSSSRRNEILNVAAKVIAERGLAGATVRDIGQAAGILSGSLYHHFESKEQIVIDLLLHNVERLFVAQNEVADTATSASEALAGLIRLAVEETALHPNESLILRNETRAFRDAEILAPIAEFRRKTVLTWTGVIRRGVDSGEFRSDLDVDTVVYALIDAVLGAARWFTNDSPREPGPVADALIGLTLHGVVAP